MLIWLSDEEGSLPCGDLCRKFRLVLKSYWPLPEGWRNVLPFPLCGTREVLAKKPLPWAQRDTAVFFTGNLNANRVDFYRQFNLLRSFPPMDLPFYWQRRIYWELLRRLPLRRDFSGAFPHSRIIFTQGFRTGMSPTTYAENLAKCKITICPPGFTSAETIRHFEAMRLGCVIVSAPLPPNPFYAESPIVLLKNWRSLHRCLSALLFEDGKDLQKRAEATYQWWETKASPKAMAKLVSRRLESD